MTCCSIDPNLNLIDLDQDMTGFRKFISAWLYADGELTFVVDPGPSHSIEFLIKTLKDLNIKKIDYILLTHIHIDHAGGAGRLLEAFPMAEVICHEKGIPHMVSPQKLWQGSLKVLGKIAEGYGEIIPVPQEKIRFADKIDTPSGIIQVVETPGHAIHHFSYLFKDYLFAGEVAGVIHKTENNLYARPATPPVFKQDISLSSLETVATLDFEGLCCGHYGYHENPKSILLSACEQLRLWVDVVKDELKQGEDGSIQRIIDSLLKKDELFRGVINLDDDIRQREDYFIKNSIKGMIQFVKEQTAS
ncbi:MBL fold metallo-hydrolase [bacterium]|nr:MBL fold metallo-hydrolase [bacterium]